MKSLLYRIFRLYMMVYLFMPKLASAGGDRASTLIVVADTRRVSNPILLYFANLYNTNIWLFAIWTVVLTAAFGCVLGFLMDFIMLRTGLDLRSRKLIEH